MVNCSYCGKQLDRKVFCNNSHKVMYHKAPGEVAETAKDKVYSYNNSDPITEFNPAPKPKK